MAGAGYNIPISASASAGSGVNSPFSDDTYIVFSGSTLSSYQPVTNSPDISTSATSSAAEGNAAATSATQAGAGGQPAGQVNQPIVSAAGGLSTTDYVLLGGFASLILVITHFKI